MLASTVIKLAYGPRARMPRKELLPLRSSLLRNYLEIRMARIFLKEGGKGWRARKFLKERRGRMARNFLDARKFLASRIFLEIRMAIEEPP